MKNVMSLQNIKFRYKKGKYILNDLNMDIPKGEVIAIAGPNGIGKSTLIKHLNGLLKPESGEIYLNERAVKDYKELRKSVQIVFQNPDEQIFFPGVEDDIVFGLRNRGLDEDTINEKLENILDILNIKHLRHRNFFNLSFGEKKKVAFAGVLILTPEILVLDEPTIGIDPWAKPQFLELIKEMSEHSTIVIASHDFDVLKLVDRIYLMSEGKVHGTYDSFEQFFNHMNEVKIKS